MEAEGLLRETNISFIFRISGNTVDESRGRWENILEKESACGFSKMGRYYDV